MAFIAFCLVLGLAVVPWLINNVAKQIFLGDAAPWSPWGYASASRLFAVGLGLSLTIGAFIMGVLISQSKHVEDVTHKIGSIKEMFMAVFFVSIGMLVDPVLVVQGLLVALVIALVFVLRQDLQRHHRLLSGEPSGKDVLLCRSGDGGHR